MLVQEQPIAADINELGGHQSFSILEKGGGLVDSLALHRTYVRDLESELYEMRKAADLKI